MGKALFIFIIIIVIGVFVSVSMNLQFYQQQFRDKFTAAFLSLLPQEGQEIDEQKIQELIENIPFFTAVINLLAPITAFTVWIILEIIRQFGSLIAGIISSTLIRVYARVSL